MYIVDLVMAEQPASIIFQAAKLGHVTHILQELEWAQTRLGDQTPINRIYGVSGGALSALAFALAVAAKRDPNQFAHARSAINDLRNYLQNARNRDLHRWKLNPWFGFFHLKPLRSWLKQRLEAYGCNHDLQLSALPISLYLCAADRDGTFTLFGPPDSELQFQYTWIKVGPPRDALILDALIAAVSTSLSTEPARVNNALYRDCRPAINDASAIIADLEAASARPIWVLPPYTPPPSWKLNWITSSFIMHRHHEQNQALLARYYTDLLDHHRGLKKALGVEVVDKHLALGSKETRDAPSLAHIDLPYIGSTEAFTNMRESVAQKDGLMSRFHVLLAGQVDEIRFNQPTNVIYGAGGFSGILAGLVTSRQVEAGFRREGGDVEQIYGVSAGVLNGFFHAVQVAARDHPELYTSAAEFALNDLEQFFEHVSPRKIARLNLHPRRFWEGWANLEPLRRFLSERLAAYTDSPEPGKITFDEIQLPLTVAVARNDGLTDFLGMTQPERYMRFAGCKIQVSSAPIVQALIAGWSMNTYIQPMTLGDQKYRDGGGSFYDPALFVACMDDRLTNLLNIHLDEPEGHTYNLPERPNLLRLLFDTHNYNFPEERRRMRLITDLLYEHYSLRNQAQKLGVMNSPDFRQEWDLPDPPLEIILSDPYTGEDEERR